MRPVAPRTGAPETQVAEEQEEYLPLAVAEYRFGDGAHGRLTRWTFTPEERAAVARGEDVYVMQLYFRPSPMTPLVVRCGPGDFMFAESGPRG